MCVCVEHLFAKVLLQSYFCRGHGGHSLSQLPTKLCVRMDRETVPAKSQLMGHLCDSLGTQLVIAYFFRKMARG